MSATDSVMGEATHSSAPNHHHHHHHHRAFSQDENLLDGDDGDEVFSNPDTAEIESSRSDATGATSPTPNSPGPSSPSNRGLSHIAIVTSQHPSDVFGTMKQSDVSSAQGQKQSVSPLSLASLPQTDLSQLQSRFEQDFSVETPKATSPAASTTSARPQYGRTLSASGAAALQAPSMLPNNSGSRISTPRMGGHASSHSTSYLNLSLAHGQPLPSAHDMPADPKEASTLSKLFARKPAQSPSEELTGFALSPAAGAEAGSPHSMFRSATASQLNSPATPIASFSPLGPSRMFRSRPATRAPSPERVAAQGRGSNAGLGLGVLPKDLSDSDLVASHGPSIFERDIEHRDTGHVLSKQEAIDVAIPSVLDDAIEAITGEDSDMVEIVAPHASPAPLALSTQALSAHSQGHSRVNLSQVSSASSPANSPSPPMSSSGNGGNEAPPGSMAAQIAERLAGRAAVAEEGAPSTSRHRRPNSDVSLSSSSSMRSRSPQVPLAAGVQQVLDASNSPLSPSTPAPKTSSSSPVAAGSSPHFKWPLPTTSTATSHANLASLTTHSSTPKHGTALPTATALPSLPLPNPFRTHSPSTSLSPLPDGGMPMSSSVSMDGAVMATSDSATMDASLSGLVDVIATSHSANRRTSTSSPLSKTRALAIEEDVGPYSSRALPSTISSASPKTAVKTTDGRSMPGGFFLGLPEEESSTSPRATRSSAASSTLAKKRLSFFSYADIINHTPAELIDLDTALRQADEAVLQSSSTAATPSRSISLGPRASTADK